MGENLVISINRQYGSGGREIGEKLAQRLGIKYYDKDIVTLAAKKSGIKKDYFERVDEQPTDSFLYALAMNTFSVNSGINPFDNALSSDKLFNMQAEVIKELADEESFVLIGRCGGYILREKPRCVSIYICSSLEKRVERLCKRHNITEKEAKKRIASTDKKRESYYGYYAGENWSQCSSYDLAVNTSEIDIDKAVDVIANYIKTRFDS